MSILFFSPENSGYIRSTTSSSPETVSNTHIEGDATTQALPTTTTGTVPEKSKQNHTGKIISII